MNYCLCTIRQASWQGVLACIEALILNYVLYLFPKMHLSINETLFGHWSKSKHCLKQHNHIGFKKKNCNKTSYIILSIRSKLK